MIKSPKERKKAQKVKSSRIIVSKILNETKLFVKWLTAAASKIYARSLYDFDRKKCAFLTAHVL